MKSIKTYEIIDAEIQALENLKEMDDLGWIDSMISNAVSIIQTRDFPVIISGIGKAGIVAKAMTATFNSIGVPSVFLHPTEAQHGDLGIIPPNLTLILISNSGQTEELLQLVKLIRQKQKYIKDRLNTSNLIYLNIILITGNPDSPLAKEANVIISTGNPPEVCPLGLTPTTSTTVMSVIADILTVRLIEAKGLTREDYGVNHHGGYLGKKIRESIEQHPYKCPKCGNADLIDITTTTSSPCNTRNLICPKCNYTSGVKHESE